MILTPKDQEGDQAARESDRQLQIALWSRVAKQYPSSGLTLGDDPWKATVAWSKRQSVLDETKGFNLYSDAVVDPSVYPVGHRRNT